MTGSAPQHHSGDPPPRPTRSTSGPWRGSVVGGDDLSRPGAARGDHASRRARYWLGVLALALLMAMLVRIFVAETFVIPSSSMQPLLEPGDRVVVGKVGSRQVNRGDVVVFNGTATFGRLPGSSGPAGLVDQAADLLAGRPDSSDYVKRVIGVGGDRVACCSTSGAVTVNGSVLREPYLYPGDRPSEVPFEVVVPAGRVWLMGDHRSDSADSRFHLGDPGGGTVAETDVVGSVSFRFWPVDRIGGPATQGQVIPRAVTLDERGRG